MGIRVTILIIAVEQLLATFDTTNVAKTAENISVLFTGMPQKDVITALAKLRPLRVSYHSLVEWTPENVTWLYAISVAPAAPVDNDPIIDSRMSE